MSHTTKIEKYEKLSNGSVSIHISCCGEHNHRHLVAGEMLQEKDKLAKSIESARVLAAQNHEAMNSAVDHLESLIGQEVEHK